MKTTTTLYKCLVSHAGLINLESQWGTSDTIYSREINNGGAGWGQGATWREAETTPFAEKLPYTNPAVSRRKRFPRAAQSNVGKLERATAPAHPEQTDRLAG